MKRFYKLGDLLLRDPTYAGGGSMYVFAYSAEQLKIYYNHELGNTLVPHTFFHRKELSIYTDIFREPTRNIFSKIMLANKK